MTDWVDCPICEGTDMRREPEGEGYLIFCVNISCPSNGGPLEKDMKTTGHQPKGTGDGPGTPPEGGSGAMCGHKFIANGLRFATGAYSRPGGSARRVYYGHAYFCEKCLEVRIDPCDIEMDSYRPILEGATPASEKEAKLLIPQHDQPNGRYR